MSADIIEGFLCPICMKDLGTVTQLQCHFEEEHSLEDKAVFQQLKGFFDKAKKKILGDKFETELVNPGESVKKDELGGHTSYIPAWWENQEIGQIRNHTDGFRAVRDVRVNRFVVETNKLLIRLDKLLSPEAPTDPKKRKGFEKTIVRWIPDNEVSACLNCQRSFGLLTRKHHCRLCGGIMCDRCSEFMSASYARLVRVQGSESADHLPDTTGVKERQSIGRADIINAIRKAEKLVNPAHSFSGEGFLKRTNSNTSLNSLMDVDGESVMRVCKTCRKLLERRDNMTELRNTKPITVQIYDKMKMCIKEAEQIIPEYMPMMESLSQGETTYTYIQAQTLRTKLVKLYEAIDQLSKKILMLNNSDQQPNTRQMHLQKSIRLYASNFMQENLMGLQALPTEEEYSKLRDARLIAIQRKIAAERRAAMEAQERERQERDRLEKERHMKEEERLKSEDSPKYGHRRISSGGDKNKLVARYSVNVTPKGHIRSGSDTNVGNGWKPVEEVVKVSKASDPMLQQMEIIRSYIRQAKQAQRTDEVIMLEQNLRDLHTEYLRQHQQQKAHHDS